MIMNFHVVQLCGNSCRSFVRCVDRPVCLAQGKKAAMMLTVGITTASNRQPHDEPLCSSTPWESVLHSINEYPAGTGSETYCHSWMNEQRTDHTKRRLRADTNWRGICGKLSNTRPLMHHIATVTEPKRLSDWHTAGTHSRRNPEWSRIYRHAPHTNFSDR